MVYAFCLLVRLIPGKSRRKAQILSAVLWVVAVASLLGGLLLARSGDALAPIFALVGAHILFWLGAVKGTASVVLGRVA